MSSGEIWGGNGPAAGALIGLNSDLVGVICICASATRQLIYARCCPVPAALRRAPIPAKAAAGPEVRLQIAGEAALEHRAGPGPKPALCFLLCELGAGGTRTTMSHEP
jgi:hypothetical protein